MPIFRLEGRRVRTPFLEKGIHRFAERIQATYFQWHAASKEGFFQKIDGRIKILFTAFFLIIVSFKKDIGSELWIGLLILFLMAFSRLNLFRLYKKILFFGMVFGVLVILPSAFNLFREGDLLLPLFSLQQPYPLWIYSPPETIGITREGLHRVILMTLRVVNSLSITFLLLYTTPFPEIIRALKLFRVPETFLLIITLSHQYLLLFSKTAMGMHQAKKSRLMKELKPKGARTWIAGRIAFLFQKTRLRAEEVYQAMLSRGFSHSVKSYPLPPLNRVDWIAGCSLFCIGCLMLWI